MTLYSKIIGTGSYLPEKRVTNNELAAQLAAKGIETSDEWIVSRSGISARHYAEPEQASSDLGVLAARQALDAAGLQPDDIDLIIVASSTPDFFGSFPSTACIVQKKLGMTNNCAAVDVQAVCSGFVYAMASADSFIKSGLQKNVLVIGAEVFSRILNFEDRTTCVLFGDGAGAIVMTASEEPGILSCKLHADGRHSDILSIPGNVAGGAVAGSAYLYMDGQAVFKLAGEDGGHRRPARQHLRRFDPAGAGRRGARWPREEGRCGADGRRRRRLYLGRCPGTYVTCKIRPFLE